MASCPKCGTKIRKDRVTKVRSCPRHGVLPSKEQPVA